jgi:hypothetical protein
MDVAEKVWTRHGYPLPGAVTEGITRPPVARCGGPLFCAVCKEDVNAVSK